MTLKTTRLLLRPWDESDAPALYALARDPDIGPRTGWAVHRSEAQSAEIIRGVLSGAEMYAVVMRLTGRVIGSIGLHSMEGYPDGCMELGYWIGKPYWGCGFAPEAAREMLRRGFEDLGCGEIWCGHFDFNAQSKRVIEKCGFHYAATRKKAYGDGVEHTTLMYRLTREEWEAAR